ncbi:MAG: recombinase family protein [Porcipelethomonas sp.]
MPNDENSTPVIDEYASEIVRRIFEMKANGMKLKAIARELNNEHILPPSDYFYVTLEQGESHRTISQQRQVYQKGCDIASAFNKLSFIVTPNTTL